MGRADRGAHVTLTFHKCARGFTLRTGGGGAFPVVYAFDNIRDVADWLVEEYSPPPFNAYPEPKGVL